MKKNVASQKIRVFAFDSTTSSPKTGDAANLTAYISKDFGAITALTDTSATEEDATNAKGYYLFDITQSETNADDILITCKSSTANIVVVGSPARINPIPQYFSDQVIDSSGRVDVSKIAGTTQTARDIGASVLLSSGTGTGQISLSSGAVLLQPTQTGVTIPTVTTLTNLPAITAGWLTAAGIAANALNGKGDWLLSSGYTAPPSAASIRTEIDSNSTGLAAIYARTDVATSTRLSSASYTVPLDAAGTRTAVGLATANLDTQLAAIVAYVDTEVAAILAAVDTEVAAIKAKTDNLPASPAAVSDIPSASAIADAVWDEVIAGHLTAGSTGEALNAAGSAGDPWTTTLPGAYGAGTAGYLIGTYLDEAVSDPKTLTSAYDFAKGTVAMPQAYAADGVEPTPIEMLYMMWSKETHMTWPGTVASTITMSTYELNGTTLAMEFDVGLTATNRPVKIERSL